MAGQEKLIGQDRTAREYNGQRDWLDGPGRERRSAVANRAEQRSGCGG